MANSSQKLQIESIPVSSLVCDPNNARKHSDKNLEAIKGSLVKFGQQKPIVVDAKGIVIAGNGTLDAARSLGWESIDIVRTALEGADALAFALADNRTAELAEWDTSILSDTLKGLVELDFDIEAIGFDDSFLTIEPAAGLTDEDAMPENVETICKPGDLWILGNHRVLCGDSTNVQHVERLMNGEKADITFTSPPYNVIKQGFQEAKYNSGFEDRTDDEYVDFLASFTSIAIEYSNYVFVNNQSLASNRFALVEYQHRFKDKLKDILIWNKRTCPPNITKGAFNTKWEYVFCFSKDNRTRGFPCSWQGQYPNVIETENASSNEFAKVHKATFPVSFPLWIIEKMDFAKDIYEPFAGSGSTLIACEKTARKCYGMEIDPHYCDVIIKRWEDFTGKKASLETKDKTES